MFERFSDQTRRVVTLAQEEARMLDHDYLGTDHLPLALIRVDDGMAARALASAKPPARHVKRRPAPGLPDARRIRTAAALAG